MKNVLLIVLFAVAVSAKNSDDYESRLTSPDALEREFCEMLSLACDEMDDPQKWEHFHRAFFPSSSIQKKQLIASSFMEKHRVIVSLNVKHLKQQKALYPGDAGKYLIGAVLSKELLVNLDFSHGKIMLADLSDSDASASDFDLADCRKASFENTNLTNTSFSGADLRGARLNGAYYFDEYGIKQIVTHGWLRLKGATL